MSQKITQLKLAAMMLSTKFWLTLLLRVPPSATPQP